MKIIGLTGPTGAGKSALGQIAEKRFGARHIDTDKIARLVVEPGKPCLAALAEAFGRDILRPDGSLDRKALAGLVFADRRKLAKLNALTHPYITAEVRAILAEAEKAGAAFAIIDAPLLFESGENALCDITVGVIADESTRLSRIIERDGLDPTAAKSRLASAKDNAYFRERCDVILENNADRASFEKEVCRFFEALGAPHSKEPKKL